MRGGWVFLCLLCLSVAAWAAQNTVDGPRTRPELTNFEETSRYEDVLRFIAELQRQSSLVRVENFGTSHEGRALPLLILADPPVSQPRDAILSGKPVVFVFANIHGGEVEGKEAAQIVARRIVKEDLRGLLDRVIVLIAPIYNADGNEKIAITNRTAQYGPIGGVGQRANGGGLDLNRDYMKIDGPETRALIGVMNRWDPRITVDLHTTNGSYHGYHLTYSVPLNPSADSKILAYHRERMMPALTKAMAGRHKFRTYYYGNFSAPAPKPGEPDKRRWEAFSPAPRVGQNYVGFRNRLTILSEAYSYLEFRKRIHVTAAFVEEIIRFVSANGAEVRRLTETADIETVRLGTQAVPFQVGLEYEMRPLPKPVEILVGEVTKIKNPRSGRDMTAMSEDKFTRVRMQDYGTFIAKRAVPAANAYLFRRGHETAKALEKLLHHGIAAEELTEGATLEAGTFQITEVGRQGRSFQGPQELRLKGQTRTEKVEFPAGTVVVRTAQPLGRLAAYLLEPASDDGLSTWNQFGSLLAAGQTHPVYKYTGEVRFSTRILGR